MSEVQALVPAGWVDSCPWATLLGLHSRAEWSWDVHFWFWSPQHHFYWPMHYPVPYLLREALAEALLETRTQATVALSGLPLTSLWWWIFHGLLRPSPNHCCHLLATAVSTDHSNHKLGYHGTQGWKFQCLLSRYRCGLYPKLGQSVVRAAHFSTSNFFFEDQKLLLAGYFILLTESNKNNCQLKLLLFSKPPKKYPTVNLDVLVKLIFLDLGILNSCWNLKCPWLHIKKKKEKVS